MNEKIYTYTANLEMHAKFWLRSGREYMEDCTRPVYGYA
jgi:hypothetical protein